jgi:hypothetical protein
VSYSPKCVEGQSANFALRGFSEVYIASARASGVLHAFPRRANILPTGNPKASGGDGLLRLLLVEDHAAFRSALALLLGLRPA